MLRTADVISFVGCLQARHGAEEMQTHGQGFFLTVSHSEHEVCLALGTLEMPMATCTGNERTADWTYPVRLLRNFTRHSSQLSGAGHRI